MEHKKRLIIRGTVSDVTAIINRIVDSNEGLTIKEYLKKMGRDQLILN